MGKGIYTYYKERLVEIGGSNKCLYLKSIVRRGAYDLGRIFEGREDKVADFIDFLWSGGRYPLSLISEGERKAILQNIFTPKKDAEEAESSREEKKKLKSAVNAERRAIENEIARLKELCREIEDIERETGRNELFVGYPFVFGSIQQGATKTLVKAPLMLFPVKIDIIDENTVEISLNRAEKIHINHALVFAYAQSKRINVDQLELEFDSLSHLKTVKSVIDYLAKAHIKIEFESSKNIFGYGKFREPEPDTKLSVRYAAVLGRFPLSNSIYNDYTLLEKKNLSNDAVNELLRTKGLKLPKNKTKKSKKSVFARKNANYTVRMLDYAQSEVVKKVDHKGNMVIYGPPGTGKSQTIVNIITDAICKGKRVLVVSQKKAALDVVYNRLGLLNDKAMYIIDEGKEKASFYSRCLDTHNRYMASAPLDNDALDAEYRELEEKINAEVALLEKINSALNRKRPFGLSLSEMYSHSYNIPKNSGEYGVYNALIAEKKLIALSYKELCDAMFGIREMKLAETYYSFRQDKERNPLVDYMLPELDIRTLAEIKGELEKIARAKKPLFNTAKYPYYRQVLAFYPQIKNEASLDSVIKLISNIESPKKLFKGKIRKQIREQFIDTVRAIEENISDYGLLRRVMTEDGYIAVIDNILRGNTSYIKLVYDALDNYIALRDINSLLESLDDSKTAILSFAYANSRSRAGYNDILAKLIDIRIYHEVLKLEEECRDELVLTVDFNNITEKIYKLKEAQLEVSSRLCAGKNNLGYETLYEKAKNNKDYLYQISKKQKHWPIRKTMEVYGEFVLSLFPCWMLSPENVSCILPLEKNMFDIVIFDEASQVFIESTIPTIYRGKSIVVAGDDKQLRPSATFMRRYLGADPETVEDYAVQAALEVDSLLDLAVARYESANLTYHYRSRHKELIDFSNSAFYSSGLQIAPNTSRNSDARPIERHLVDGRWIDRHNTKEAECVVNLLSEILKKRKNNESIGIITFNVDQQSCIADMIDKAAESDPEFRSNILKERSRIENGEDTGLFIKNLENVQGDERDIIIFSIGYAKNEAGRVFASFGSLSQDGGENRLNVAITRAKSKIHVVTSIEPEELKVDTTKNQGPKLLQKYLRYVRAVDSGDTEEIRAILSELDPAEVKAESSFTTVATVEEQMKAKLEKQGWKVDICLGNRNNSISLAVFDPKSDRYLVGIQLDKDAFAATESCLERDVYKPKFLEMRGWNIMRVWCRDWWLSPQRVIKAISAAAEEALKK